MRLGGPLRRTERRKFRTEKLKCSTKNFAVVGRFPVVSTLVRGVPPDNNRLRSSKIRVTKSLKLPNRELGVGTQDVLAMDGAIKDSTFFGANVI
jgi:uncharacterized protein (DUF1786 family)